MHFDRSPEQMGEAEIRGYLLHVVGKGISRSSYVQIRAALRFLYCVTLERSVEVATVPVQRKRRSLPVVLSTEEIAALLRAIRDPKCAAIMMVLYGAGLRISEACLLRPGDIDSARMLIWVRGGKGGKDRCTLLSVTLLSHLRTYWRTSRAASDWLFPGQTAAGHASTDTARRVFHLAAAAAGITKTVSPHVLRHSFATHLVESGTDITVVKALLGHRDLSTTEVDTHLGVEHLGRITSPLDRLFQPKRRSPRR